jgi:hypothetical protein
MWTVSEDFLVPWLLVGLHNENGMSEENVIRALPAWQIA